MAGRREYTLTELLAVMLIVLILAALLLPAVSRARENARRSHCRSNQAQFGTAVQFYANDWNDYLPYYIIEDKHASYSTEFRFFWELMKGYLPVGGIYYLDQYNPPVPGPYPGGVPRAMACPSAVMSYDGCRSALKEKNLYLARPTRAGSYQTVLLARFVLPGNVVHDGGIRVGSIRSPGSYFIVEDTGFNDRTDDREYPYWRYGGFVDGRYFWGHGRYYNVAFLDGHVRAFRRKRRRLEWQAEFTRDFSE